MLAAVNTTRYRLQRTHTNWSAIGLVAGIHAALIAGLLQVESVRTATLASLPMLVSFIATEEAKPDVLPEPRKVQSQPVSRPKPLQQPPLVTTPADSPSAIQTEIPVAEPAPLLPMQETAVEAQAVIPPKFDAAYLDNPPPAYPLISRRAGEQGRVLLRVFVSAEGQADIVTVHSTSGSHRLDLAAQEAVRRWRFTPAKQGNNAVAAWVIVPIVFQLEK